MKLGRKKKEVPANTQARAYHYDIIVSPVITEKSTLVSEHGKVMFNVKECASKSDIKAAVEALFNVKVTKVNTLIRQGKTKRFRGMPGKLSDTKKAIITLEKGQSIDMAAGVK